MSELKSHPLAEIFPLLDAAGLKELADDIKANRLRQRIVTYKGEVLDGRNRLAACKIAGIEPRLVEFTGDDPLSYVVSLNLNRRHLDTSQRAVVAAKIANLKHGGDRVSEQDANLHLGVSRQAAAGMMNVSPRSVANAARVLAHGTPELVSQVELGEMAVKEKSAQACVCTQRSKDLSPIRNVT